MRAEWIWTDHRLAADPRMIYFKKEVRLPDQEMPLACRLRICADSRYLLTINGRRVMTGPCRAPRGVRYTDELDVTAYLRPGENEIFVKVIQYPDHKEKNICFLTGPSSVVTEGIGGLWIEELETSYGFSTSAQYFCTEVSGYAFRENHRYGYIGFLEDFDGRLVTEQTPDAIWKPAVVIAGYPTEGIGALRDYWTTEPRPIPYPFETEDSFRRVMRSGGLLVESGGERFVPAGCTAFLELDAGRLVSAYPRFVFRCGSGSRLRVVYAEGYGVLQQNGSFLRGVRDNPEGQTLFGLTDLYTAHEGRQTYLPFFYRSFRFVRVEITASEDQPFFLERADYLKTGYPLEITGTFYANDERFEEIWKISKRTLLCCMYETYMDCPYYEQMQYIMDTFLEIRYTLCISGDGRLARKAIDDFARAQLWDGLLPCNSPSKFQQMIPGFPFYWILMLDTYMMYLGDRPFLRSHLGTLEKLLHYYESRVNEDGLLGDTGYWQFFDWVKEWENGSPVRKGEINILYNLLYVYALRTAAGIYRFCMRPDTALEYEARAESVAAAVRRSAYDTETGLFCDAPGRRPSSQHAQIFAVLASAVPEEEKRPLMERMLANRDQLCVPSYCMSYFLCRALEAAGLYDEIHSTLKIWDAFIDLMELHLTTWPEDFVTMRSDCHGWSAFALYEFAACYLGVRPLAPGYAKIGIVPQPCPLTSYGGTVPVGDRGLVSIAFEKDASGCTAVRVSLPEGAECIHDFSLISGAPVDIRTETEQTADGVPRAKGKQEIFRHGSDLHGEGKETVRLSSKGGE